MSYILEALKKAQAERQLGSAPTIHAAPLYPAAVRPEASRKPLLIGLGAGALAAGAAAFALMRPAAPPPAPVLPVTVAAVPVAATPAPPLPAPVAVPVAAVEPVRPPAPAPKPRVAEINPPVPKPAPVVQTPAPEPVPAPVEDNAPALSQLPESIQREIPRIAVGGYIYSPNPADRLLLIDKVLRREGEEVAPGLMLERLLPRAAVMNYRGYRYRMPY
ncbi:general secretion pathway protein GspB [Massilia cavernae]|uniref:Type II secretion system protein GspB C-terminal domain-containing protein n=1 Tax=Massilia cavernae TaxID=2320864 RepID=A0A418Y550_9BURK|nr:general secretion pathway protein GspB [Massilia cavernae]RJG21396.1 hypothetical protein D3872_06810 [Massilia cavernae]